MLEAIIILYLFGLPIAFAIFMRIVWDAHGPFITKAGICFMFAAFWPWVAIWAGLRMLGMGFHPRT